MFLIFCMVNTFQKARSSASGCTNIWVEIYFVTKITDNVIQKQNCLLKVLVIHIIFRSKLWLNFKKIVQGNPVTFTQHEKYLTQEFCWFWPIISHDLSHLVRIAYFNVIRNLFLSFLLLFLGLLVIIKQIHSFF